MTRSVLQKRCGDFCSNHAPDRERAEIAASICASHLRAMFEEAGDPDEPVKRSRTSRSKILRSFLIVFMSRKAYLAG
jgi:hypothetical protein